MFYTYCALTNIYVSAARVFLYALRVPAGNAMLMRTCRYIGGRERNYLRSMEECRLIRQQQQQQQHPRTTHMHQGSAPDITGCQQHGYHQHANALIIALCLAIKPIGAHKSIGIRVLCSNYFDSLKVDHLHLNKSIDQSIHPSIHPSTILHSSFIKRYLLQQPVAYTQSQRNDCY